MTRRSVTTDLRESHEKHLAALAEEYAELERDLEATRDTVDRRRIKRRLEAIRREMEEAESEASREELAHGGPRRSELNWKARLPRIDFATAVDMFQASLHRLHGGGAAFYMLQDGHAMRGELCVARLRDLLSEEAVEFRRYPVWFYAYDPFDEAALMDRVGTYFAVPPRRDDVREYARAVIDTICASLQAGSVVLIELTIWPDLSGQGDFLPWLLGEFWVPLLRKLNETGNLPRVKFVLILLVWPPLAPASFPPSLYCSPEQFDCEKILELPLENWREADIRDWLTWYSGLGGSLTPAQIDTMARRIYATSKGGLPPLVHDALSLELDEPATD
jgi:hypothetical protein